MTSGMNAPRSLLVPVVLLVACVAWAFVPALHGRLFFDDLTSLTQNPALERLDPAAAFDAPAQSTLAGRPVSAYSFALNAALAATPASFRIGNVLLHLATALVALALARRLFATGGVASVRTDGLALATVALWALHPLQTDAVAYAVQRTEILASLAMLGALLALTRCWDATPRRGALGVAVVCALLAAGSKETAAALPLLAACLLRGFHTSSWRGAWSRGRRELIAVAVATWLPLALLVASGARSQSVGFDHGVGVGAWLLTQAQVIPHYLRLVVWPDDLALIYEWPVVTAVGDAAGGLALTGALLVGTLWALRKAPRVGAVAAAVFLVLAPTSSFVPIWTEVAAERRMYLPSLAVIALLVSAASTLRPRVAAPVAMLLVVSLAGVLGVSTRERAARFGDGVEIWRETVEAQPHSAMAHLQLGLALRADQRLPEALEAYRRAYALDPTMSAARNNIASTLIWTGRPAEALVVLDEALGDAPDAPGLHMNRGVALSLLGRWDEAIACFDTVLALAPQFPGAAELREAARGQAARE